MLYGMDVEGLKPLKTQGFFQKSFNIQDVANFQKKKRKKRYREYEECHFDLEC